MARMATISDYVLYWNRMYLSIAEGFSLLEKASPPRKIRLQFKLHTHDNQYVISWYGFGIVKEYPEMGT